MSIIHKTVNESIATWIVFTIVAGVMFFSIMVAIDNVYSEVDKIHEDQRERYQALIGESS